jgi:NAD(P)H-dependent FMN reductase
MTRIGVILGSTRPGRRGEQVARWAMGVVSYGAVGGARAAEHLRLIAGELQMADVRTNVALSLFTDFENFAELAPGPHQAQALDTLLGEVVRWSEALAPLRQGVGAAQPG